jgi:hypothetical protein
MTKKRKQNSVEASTSDFNKLQKQVIHQSKRDKLGADDFFLDSDAFQRPFRDFKFLADTPKLRRDFEGLLVGCSRDLYEQFQLLKMTDSDCHSNTETGEDASSLSTQIVLTVL